MALEGTLPTTTIQSSTSAIVCDSRYLVPVSVNARDREFFFVHDTRTQKCIWSAYWLADACPWPSSTERSPRGVFLPST